MDEIELIEKKSKNVINDRYSFPCTREMKISLDKLKDRNGDFSLEVNEMFRRYAERIISQAEDKKKQTA